MDVAVVPFQANRFSSAARHYHARMPYAERVVRRTAEFCRLDRQSRIIDLGCGPGQLAIAFAPLVGQVLAIDPAPAMLALARESAADLDGRIEFIEGSSADLGPRFGIVRAVVMGRSFHWMDRIETLRRLDGMIEPGGSVVLFETKLVKTPEMSWFAGFREIATRYGEMTGTANWKGAGWVEHEAVLLDSPFRVLDRIGAIDRFTIPAESIVDLALSMSRTAPDRLGPAKTAALTEELLRYGRDHAVDGRLVEVVESSALIARRR